MFLYNDRDQPDLLAGEGGAAAGHHVLDARLVERDHVGIASTRQQLSSCTIAFFGEVDPVERLVCGRSPTWAS